MSTVTSTLPAEPSRVFTALADARALRYFVPGARTVRRFDPTWPEAGAEMRHSLGVGPLVIRDSTVVLDCEPPERLVLEAHARLLGTFEITFSLQDADGRTTLRIEETAVAGPLTLPVLRQVGDALITARNHEMCRRLANLVQSRERQRAAENGQGSAEGMAGADA